MILALPVRFSFLFLHTRPVVFVPCGDPRKSPVHSFNGVIISSARICTFTVTFQITLPPGTNLFPFPLGV